MTSELQKTDQTDQQEMQVISNETQSLLMDAEKFDQAMRIAEVYAASTMVPEHYRNNPSNVFCAMQMAIRLDCDLFQFLQSSYIVHGKAGIESKLAIAMLNSSGLISGSIQYQMDGSGKSRSCTAVVTDRKSGQPVSETVTMEMAHAEGWVNKSGSKWKTIPDLMLKYRAAMWLIRLHYPGVVLGMQSAEEIEDTTFDVTPTATRIEPIEVPKLDPPKKPKRKRTVKKKKTFAEYLADGNTGEALVCFEAHVHAIDDLDDVEKAADIAHEKATEVLGEAVPDFADHIDLIATNRMKEIDEAGELFDKTQNAAEV